MDGTLSTSIWTIPLLTTMMMLLSCVTLSTELHVSVITATGRMTGAEPECSHQVSFFVALAERVEPRDPPQVSDSQAKSSCRVLVQSPGIETATTADNRGISSGTVRLPEARPSQPLHQQLSQQAVANEVEYLEKMSGDVDDLCEIGQNIEFNESVHDQYEYEQNESKIASVKSRLRDHIEFWKSNLFANEFILNTLQYGYIIPFKNVPPGAYLKNNRSSLVHSEFVKSAILELLQAKCVTEVEMPYIVNPLTVSVNSSGKKRLVLDLFVTAPKQYFMFLSSGTHIFKHFYLLKLRWSIKNIPFSC